MENIQKYGIAIEFDTALKKLQKFQKMSQGFARRQQQAQTRQVVTAQNSLMAEKARIAAGRERIKQLEREDRLATKNRGLTEVARRRQAIGSLTSTTGQAASKTAFADMMRKEEAARSKRAKALVSERQQRRKLVEAVRRQTWYMEAQNKEQIESIINGNRRLGQLKNALAAHKQSLKMQKQQSKELKFQDRMLRRMKGSSDQFAGNMVSAFAIAAGVASVTRIGQDFEAVNNTMLAVSKNAQESGQNFKFVRDEAFRLGLGLKESAKGFAKLVAARGDMSLEDTKRSFTGIAEMSTLLGLSATESTRALNALQQIKGCLPNTEMCL